MNDFLSGAAPLNLTMRLGDHMMLIQLQLSTVNQMSSSSSSRHHHHTSSSSRSSRTSSTTTSSPHYPTPSTSGQNQPQQQKVRLPLLSPGGLYSSSAAAATPSTSHHHAHPPSHRAAAPAPAISDTPLDGPPLAKKPKLDTRALAEASKNLTQTLKQLSSEVLITRPEAAGTSGTQQQQQQSSFTESTPRPRREVCTYR